MALKIKLITNQMIWQDNLYLFNSQIDLLRKTYELNRLNHQLISNILLKNLCSGYGAGDLLPSQDINFGGGTLTSKNASLIEIIYPLKLNLTEIIF